MELDGQDGTDGAAVPQDGGSQSSAVADPAVAGAGPVLEASSDTGGTAAVGTGPAAGNLRRRRNRPLPELMHREMLCPRLRLLGVLRLLR